MWLEQRGEGVMEGEKAGRDTAVNHFGLHGPLQPHLFLPFGPLVGL